MTPSAGTDSIAGGSRHRVGSIGEHDIDLRHVERELGLGRDKTGTGRRAP